MEPVFVRRQCSALSPDTPPRDTRPIIKTGASIILNDPRISDNGHIEYANHLNTVAWERVTGCLIYNAEQDQWSEQTYRDLGIDDIVNQRATTSTILIIWQDWFRDITTRRQQPH